MVHAPSKKVHHVNYFVADSRRKQIKKVLSQNRARTKKVLSAKNKALIRKSKKILEEVHVPKAKLSSYFVSSDILKRDIKSQSQLASKVEFDKKIEVARALNTGLKTDSKKSRLSHFEIIRRNIMIMVRRFLAWFSNHSARPNLTLAGRRALLQLGELYDLLLLEAIDDEALLKLKVAYGEACYYVTQASRSYQKKHRGRGRENYSTYFDRFVDCASG